MNYVSANNEKILRQNHFATDVPLDSEREAQAVIDIETPPEQGNCGVSETPEREKTDGSPDDIRQQ